MKKILKPIAKKMVSTIFHHGMSVMDENPALRQSLINLLRQSGALKKIKKLYFARLSKADAPFSHLMIGPVVAIDISLQNLSPQNQAIYQSLKNKAKAK